MPSSLHAMLATVSLVAAAALGSTGLALAQAKQEAQPPAQAAPAQQAPEIKQIALTDKHVENLIAAQPDMDAITSKLPDNAAPDPKVTAQLEDVAKKHGFASFDEFNTVMANVGLVLGGFDPATKKYVGPEAVIKAQIAQVQADKKMPANDKKEALADLNQALKTPTPAVTNKGNIDLVGKNYDKLVQIFGGEE
jgi:hypothetical protein